MSAATRIVDFDRAYDNSGAVEGAPRFAERWRGEAEAFRAAMSARGRIRPDITYGPGERNRFDLFLPEETPAGLCIYIHGGYWKAFDKSVWSHLARGSLERGFAVAIPSYTLCPEIRLSGIVQEIGQFLDRAAAEIDGPIHVAGHSAGGHLATRMGASGAPIAQGTAARLAAIVSISGVHDLRPIQRTRMNEILRIDPAEALVESPALLEPAVDVPVTAYVGGAELPEFRRQAAFLASAWHGLGARIACVEADGRHHFDVVEDLADPGSPLTRLLTGASPA